MSPIEQAARALCSANGETEDDLSGGTPMWKAYLTQVMTVIAALHEPSLAMMEAGSEIIRHVSAEESEAGRQGDAANVWRFMIDTLRRDAAHIRAR